MIHSEDCVKLVASFEGLSLKAYQDQRGIWTIGYGHTANVKEGDTCTQLEAEAWLDADLLIADKALQRLAPVPFNQNQYDALCSLIYNIGQGNFASSTILNELIAGDYDKAGQAILMWDKTNGQVNPGLLRRRQAELLIYSKP